MLKGLILQFQWSIKRALCSLFLILSFLTIFFLVSGSLFGVFIVFFVCHLQLLLFETLFQLSPSFSLISIDNYNNNNNILVIIFFSFPSLLVTLYIFHVTSPSYEHAWGYFIAFIHLGKHFILNFVIDCLSYWQRILALMTKWGSIINIRNQWNISQKSIFSSRGIQLSYQVVFTL